MNFQGVIPARGGSKGIKNKNLAFFKGKPLIYWTLEQAKASEILDDFFVSSDDEEILKYAEKQGVKTHERDKSLAEDNSTTLELLEDLNRNKDFVSQNYVILQPTSPLRKRGIIDRCIEEYLLNKYDCLATGRICKNYEWGKTNNTGRQNLSGWFYDDGSIYVLSKKLIDDGKWYGENSGKILQEHPWYLEIDSPSDLKILEYISKNLEDFI